MAQFRSITSIVVPLLIDNIDTDQIIPARFLKVTDKQGLGDKLFYDWRYNVDGTLNPEFVINRAQYQGAQILLAGDNFGCGSSREHAPWALTAFGFRAVISTTIADIFKNNALKNGLLPIVLSGDEHRRLKEEILANPNAKVTINLEEQVVVYPSGHRASFEIDPFSKFCLLNGVDELEYIRRFEEQIQLYEQSHNK
ncbi:MAG: 3-isopropylmalate dehydratase small subunit [Bacteroidetes bacterium]|nr:3-isopropylmalate dehydratase small subunit [Bacteroidota bacterium]